MTTDNNAGKVPETPSGAAERDLGAEVASNYTDGITGAQNGSDDIPPEFGTEDYRRWAVLFNDITFAPTERHVLFSERRVLTDYLWRQGWRRDVRPEDVIAATIGDDQ